MITIEHYKEIIADLKAILTDNDDYASTREAIRAIIADMHEIAKNKEA